jgi:hypothetical protein
LSLREQAGMRDGGQIMLRDGDQILRKAWVTLFR